MNSQAFSDLHLLQVMLCTASRPLSLSLPDGIDQADLQLTSDMVTLHLNMKSSCKATSTTLTQVWLCPPRRQLEAERWFDGLSADR